MGRRDTLTLSSPLPGYFKTNSRMETNDAVQKTRAMSAHSFGHSVAHKGGSTLGKMIPSKTSRVAESVVQYRGNTRPLSPPDCTG